MVKLRKGVPKEEKWNAEKLAEHLNIDIMKAKKYFDEYHRIYGGGYGDIEKALILDFVNQKQREEREREARYKSDLSNVEQLSVLREQVNSIKEQVKTLKEMNESTSKYSLLANIIAFISLIVAIIALCIR